MTRYTPVILLVLAGCQSWNTGAAFVAYPPPLADHQQSERVPVAESAPSESTVHEPELAYLQMALDEMENGDADRAITHFEKFLLSHPRHLTARVELAELLFEKEDWDRSRLHFELFVVLAQEYGRLAVRPLVHAHSRLVEIAEAQGDAYAEHLNRGIGLFYLACRRAEEPDPEGENSADSLLCRAVLELQEARIEKPDQARVHWYLYQAWSRLGQRAAATRALVAADQLAMLSRLTPTERRELEQSSLLESNFTELLQTTP